MATAIDSQALHRAFRSFAELSASLETSYRALESQVARLSVELGSTERARVAELEARERLAARMGRLLEVLPGGVLILDENGTILEANPAAISMLGDPLRGEPWAHVRARVVPSASPYGGDIALANGRWVSLSERPLASEAGSILLITDVTESHLVRELASRRERLAALGELAAKLAHQLRTPLAAAMLYATQLRNAPASRRAALSERIVARLRSLEALIADMLGYARGGGNGVTELAVAGLLEDVAQTLAARLALGGRLTLRVRKPGLVVCANRDAVCGALANLVENALDVIGPTADVVIEAADDPDAGVELRVSDNGPGVDTADRERIFEPFYSARAGGTGLGLAVARGVALAHGGTLRCEACERGALFVMTLPVRKRDSAPVLREVG
jgi:two-component system sensor histidine kinase FlrB